MSLNEWLKGRLESWWLPNEGGDAEGTDLAVRIDRGMSVVWVCELDAPAPHLAREFQIMFTSGHANCGKDGSYENCWKVCDAGRTTQSGRRGELPMSSTQPSKLVEEEPLRGD
jgi:hypothetical protein